MRFAKLLFLTSLAVVMVSCDGPVGFAVHSAKVDDHNYRIDNGADSVMDFVIKNNQMLLCGSINGEPDTLLFDSGAGQYLVRFFNKNNKPKGMKFYKIPMTGADKNTEVKATVDSCRIELPIRKVKAMQMLMLMDETHACENELRVDQHPILGFPAMDGMMFDFSHNQFRERVYLKDIDTITEFLPVRCRRDLKGVLFVYLTIDGVERECIFDTGNSAGIILKDDDRIDHPHETDLLYEGSYGLALGGKTSHQHFVVASDVPVNLNGNQDTCKVMFVKELEYNNIGLPYIAKYDWVIFGYLGKVYARPRTTELDHLSFTKHQNKRYGITTMEGNIKILCRLLDGKERYEVGEVIDAVNGEKITEENICHYYDLLNESGDWDELDITTRK